MDIFTVSLVLAYPLTSLGSLQGRFESVLSAAMSLELASDWHSEGTQ